MDLETILAASLALGALFVLVFYFIFRSPFRYQYRIFEIDISGKHSPDIKDIIDDLLIREGIVGFSTHKQLVDQWKINCQNRVEKSLLKKLRAKQFAKCVDDERMFCFKLVRRKTQYKQVNYVKSSYYVYKTVGEYSFGYNTIKQRYDALSKIDFECTLAEYNTKNQRKMMTPALREEIAKRDHYTCQMCGKYMPDGVGLHIDHIIPIKKGGKSIPSNLQVLCSKCNGRKSSN